MDAAERSCHTHPLTIATALGVREAQLNDEAAGFALLGLLLGVFDNPDFVLGQAGSQLVINAIYPRETARKTMEIINAQLRIT